MTLRFAAKARSVGLSLLAIVGMATAANADSLKDEGRAFSWSATGYFVSDYVFRGFSYTNEDPTVQAYLEANYGILYAGAFLSGLDLGQDALGRDIANFEIDYYLGIRPTWGPVNFDFSAAYYNYPGAKVSAIGGVNEIDQFELKASANVTPTENLSLTGTVFWTPDYSGELGEVWTFEGTAGYTLPAVGPFVPTVSGVLGHAIADERDVFDIGKDDYTYWNLGLTLAVEKFSFDFRYWDTDIDSNLTDDRFVFTASITLP